MKVSTSKAWIFKVLIMIIALGAVLALRTSIEQGGLAGGTAEVLFVGEQKPVGPEQSR